MERMRKLITLCALHRMRLKFFSLAVANESTLPPLARVLNFDHTSGVSGTRLHMCSAMRATSLKSRK
jgi:hypothetical protein